MIQRSRGVLLALVVSLGARSAGGAANSWTPVGPFSHGGIVTAIAVAPSDSATVYTDTFSGVFRSADAGASWSSINDGLPSRYAFGIAVDPGSPSTAYAAMGNPAPGLYKTTNAGRTWTQLRSLDPQSPLGTIAIDPTDPRVLYFGVQGGIFKSVDGGASWTASTEGFGDVPVASIAVDPANHSTLYAAAGPVYRSTDSGVHWGATGLVSSYAVRIAPSDPSTLYAATATGVFVSHDGAQTWTAGGAITGIPGDLAVDPESAGTVFVTGVDGVSKSTDGGASWQLANSGLPSIRCMNPITIASDATLYAGNMCAEAGLFTSTDAAASWTDTSGDFAPIGTFGLSTTAASPAIYAATNSGIFRTVDGGGSWTALNGGLTDLDIAQVVPDPTDPDILYARTGTPTGLFKTVDGGLTWTHVAVAFFAALAIAPSAPSTLYAASFDGDFWKTTDGGASWRRNRPFLSLVDSITVDPRNDAVVFAGSGGRLYRSTDGGATWTAVLTPSRDGIFLGATFTGLEFAPGSPDTVYVGWVVFPDPPEDPTTFGGVYRSADGGATWASAFAGDGVIALAVDPLQATTLYIGTTAVTVPGLLRSTDGGATFEMVSTGLPVGFITDIAIHPDSPATVYAAVAGYGVFRADFVSCASDGTALCLGGGRFEVEVDWQRTPEDPAQKAHAEGVSTQSGDFWFSDPSSVELVVKVLDGRSVNGFFWVFYGALTDRGYTITVTDRETGEVRTYTNAPGHIGSRADTAAFAAAGEGPQSDEDAELALVRALSAQPRSAAADVCVADGLALCLNGGRFRVQVGLTTSPSGPVLAAPAIPLTGDSGAFAFRDLDNLEVAVKVLDGTFVNGHFWVFVGGLSDRAFQVSVIDTTTGQSWSYDNPAGVVQSVADLSAF